MTALPTIRDPRKSFCGGVLTVHDLPKAGERKRWTPLYKAIIAGAIKHRVLSPEEACERYCMTALELKRWIDLLEAHGIPGLGASKFQPDYVPEHQLDDHVPALRDGPLLLDFKTKTVTLGDRVLFFTPYQFQFLSILMRRAPATVSREDMYAFLYGDTNKRKPEARILDVFVCKMRRQLGPAIETVWGRGWRWKGLAS